MKKRREKGSRVGEEEKDAVKNGKGRENGEEEDGGVRKGRVRVTKRGGKDS